MRRIRYSVATSLDGFIAGPNGEYDWIVQDPAIDMAARFSQFDTLLMGRHTYELAISHGGNRLKSTGKKIVVVSTTLDPAQHPDATILSGNVAEAVAALKAEPAVGSRGKSNANSAKDIWLFGGGVLFRSLLDAGLVDLVELGVSPVLLGSGIPLLPHGSRHPLRLIECKTLPNSGIVMLTYSAAPQRAAA